MRDILSGNEAIARGAWEAGVRFAAAYPGTPSTEILEAMPQYEGDIYSEWSPNEKVAFEVALGASLAGARALVAMKHVGVNVAADPLFTASYTGVKGGFVLVSADDPSLHSSQNEQDNRNYARFAKVPLLEPADSQEAKDFVGLACELSERYDTPVILRTTTRISHSKSIVELGERAALDPLIGVERDIAKYVMVPSNATKKHPLVEQRLRLLAELAEEMPQNRIEPGDRGIGIVAAGVAYMYAREAFPAASFLKLGMAYPLPAGMIRRFRAMVDRLYVVEELDPFLEEQIRLMGVRVDGGKEAVPLIGELDPGIVARALSGVGAPGATAELLAPVGDPVPGLPGRPPTLCPGCSHRGVFIALRKLKVFVSGDIGCYTLGALEPFKAMHTCICMGASIGGAHGMEKVTERDGVLKNRAVAVIGDSTFFHSGITALLDVAWNRSDTVTVILDNRITAMTGGQQTPGAGKTLGGLESPPVDIPRLCEALGIERVRTVDPGDIAAVEAALREEIAADGPSVIIAPSRCALVYRLRGEAWHVDPELCTGCKVCLKAGCGGLMLVEDEEGASVEIVPSQCTGCGVCAQLCKQGAILAPAIEEAIA
ncbi:MAG: indolepyruvate ferredoxin oxidoreductase subunit alpha [Actinomycetes bacterium]